MSKDAYYFSHDANAHTDPKIVDLLMDLKAEGYGVYWVIIEMLRNEESYSLCSNDYNAIAYQSHSSPDVVERVILNYNLFTIDQSGEFWSESLKERMEHLNAKRLILSNNAKKRWLNSNAHTNALQMQSSKVKESKVKESKVKESIKHPKLEDVLLYCKETNSSIDGEYFWNFYNQTNWVKANGQIVINWKSTIKTWEKNNMKDKEVLKKRMLE